MIMICLKKYIFCFLKLKIVVINICLVKTHNNGFGLVKKRQVEPSNLLFGYKE